MSERPIPHYVKFARAMALVSVTLPMPAVMVASATGCNGDATNGPAAGLTVMGDGGGVQGPPNGSAPAPQRDAGQDAQDDAMIGMGGIQVADSGTDADSQDAADDGGGPHRGTPELPDSFLA